jgi:hypothetical protein
MSKINNHLDNLKQQINRVKSKKLPIDLNDSMSILEAAKALHKICTKTSKKNADS